MNGTSTRLGRIRARFLIGLGVIAGCADRNYSQPEPASEQAEHTLSLWRVFMVAGAAVGGLVLGLIVYVSIRYRRRSDAMPSQKSVHVRWEAIYTITPIVLVAVLFGLSVSTQAKIDEKAETPDLVINVTGFQWGWQFEYPQQGVTVTGSGSAGEQPTLVLPEGQTARLVLRTVDVIHSFWLPEFLIKRDLIPGIDNTIDITPNRLGTFDGHCAEYCLLDHWRMMFIVEIVPPDEFDAQLADAVAATRGRPS
jgi:cytochrome c oxidase subunit 2